MLGQEFVSKWTRYFSANASNFPNDDIGLNDMSLGETPGIPTSGVNFDDKLLSFFTRLNYNFKEKYLFTFHFVPTVLQNSVLITNGVFSRQLLPHGVWLRKTLSETGCIL